MGILLGHPVSKTRNNGLDWSGHGNSMQEKNNHKKFIEIFGEQKTHVVAYNIVVCVRSLLGTLLGI